jgi:hypothetical protein
MSNSDIPVSPDFEPVPGIEYEDAKVEQPSDAPASEPAPEPTAPPVEEPAKPEAKPEPVKERPQKAKPIADLLQKKHDAEVERDAALAKAQELEVQLAQAANRPASPQADADVKALAEQYGLDESLLASIVATARKGFQTEVPKEVQDLLAERETEKQQQAELTAFNKRVESLAKTLPDESFNDPQVKKDLLELAYSTELAPDGEPYFQKELSELYFAYIKPEIEPGKTSAEPSQGGTQGTTVVDFEEIFTRDNPKDIDDMDSETFTKYNAWVKEHKETLTPLKRA